MKFKKTVFLLSITAFTAAAVIGAAAFRTASAQEETPTTTLPEESTTILRGPDHHGFVDGAGDEELANALGISEDELDAARQEAKEAALAQAVEEGLITQAQADALSENERVFPFGGRGAGWLGENGIDFEAFLAEALGISVDELQAAKQTAVFAQIDAAVEDGRLTEEKAELFKGRYALNNSETFQTSMQSAFEAAVSQAVSDGVITQAQADQILENEPWSGGKGGFLGGIFGGPGRHGHGRWGGEAPENLPAPESTEGTP